MIEVMQHLMEQAVTLGAYAGTVALPLVRTFGTDRETHVANGLVSELWAGLPIAHPVSFVDPSVLDSPHDRTSTVRDNADGLEPARQPADLVPDALDMIRTIWQVVRQGSPQEIAVVVRFRLADLASGMDHLYAVRTDAPTPRRPGTFEAIVRECLDLVTAQRNRAKARQLTDCDLHEHALRVGGHLVECLIEGTPCRLLTTPQVDLLQHQVISALHIAGLPVLEEGDDSSAGVLLVAIDDVDLSDRHIELHWRCTPDLQRRARQALRDGDYSAEVLKRTGGIQGVMRQALQEILRHAGFETAIDPDIGEHHLLVTGLREPEMLRGYVSPELFGR